MQLKRRIPILLVGFLLFAFILSAATGPAAAETLQQEDSQSLWDVIQAQEDLSSFAAWIEAAGLADNLDNDGPFTVFAPTNEAMATFTSEAAQSTASRTDILLYHILNGRYNDPYIASFSTRPTLLGEQLDISVDAGQIMLNEAANVTMTDLAANNGVVHIVDEVLLPPENSLFIAERGSREDTVVGVLAADGRFTTFLSLLEQAGLQGELADPNLSFTVFAPVDGAFDELTEAQVNDWVSDPEDLETLLSYHIVNDRLGINQIATDDLIPTAEGRPLRVSQSGDDMTVSINNQPLDEFNIIASNGVIHVVDHVLTP